MNILQWNVNGLHTYLNLILYRGGMPQQQFVYKKHLCPAHTNFVTDILHISMTIWPVIGWKLVLPSLYETAYTHMCFCCKEPCRLFLYICGSPHIYSLQCILPTQHCYLVGSQDFLSELSAVFYCLETWMHSTMSGAVQMRTESDRWWTLISRFNCVVLNTGEPTHLSLVSGNPVCRNLAMCSPAVSASFVQRLLDDLCWSDRFLICLSTMKCPPWRGNSDWVVKDANWSLSSEFVKIEETSFPTLDSVMDEFTYTIQRASEHSIPWLSTRRHHMPVPWWTKEHQDAVSSQKQVVRNIRWHSTEAGINASLPEHRTWGYHDLPNGWPSVSHTAIFCL